uniref:Uncharacterized protein n=1 Tax=Glossina pallidipes TaxID=7398 RepID=A0A1A9ZPQ5_GLOPL
MPYFYTILQYFAEISILTPKKRNYMVSELTEDPWCKGFANYLISTAFSSSSVNCVKSGGIGGGGTAYGATKGNGGGIGGGGTAYGATKGNGADIIKGGGGSIEAKK